MAKHSVTKEIEVTVSIEDIFEEMDTEAQKEFLTQKFDELETKAQKEVANDCLELIPFDKDLAEVLKDKFFYLDESYQTDLLTDIIDMLTTSQAQRLMDYLQED